MIFGLFDAENYSFLNHYSIPHLTVGLIFLWLAFFVLSKGPTKKKNILLAIFNFYAAWWLLWFFIAYNTINPTLAYVLIKVGFLGVNFLAAAILHFFMFFIGQLKKYATIVYAYYAIAFTSAIIILSTDWILADVQKFPWGYYTSDGPLLIPFIILFASCIIMCLVIIFNGFRKKLYTDQQFATTLKFITAGLIVMTPGLIDFIPNFGYNLYPFGCIFFLAYSFIFLYTVVNYRMLDIDTVFHKTLVWFFTSVFVLLPMFIILLPMAGIIKGFNLLEIDVFYLLFFVIFNWYKGKIHSQINVIFRRKKYHYQEALTETTKEVFSSEDLEAACEKLYDNIFHIFYPQRLTVLVNRNGQLTSLLVQKQEEDYFLDPEGRIYQWLTKNRKPLFKENIKLDSDNRDNEIYNQLIRDEIEGAVPIVFRDNILGVVVIGRKENLKFYNTRDVKLLERICRTAGPAINNFIQSDRLIQKEIEFNKFLETEFWNRTRELAEKNQELIKINQQTEHKRLQIEDLKSQVNNLKALIN